MIKQSLKKWLLSLAGVALSVTCAFAQVVTPGGGGGSTVPVISSGGGGVGTNALSNGQYLFKTRSDTNVGTLYMSNAVVFNKLTTVILEAQTITNTTLTVVTSNLVQRGFTTNSLDGLTIFGDGAQWTNFTSSVTLGSNATASAAGLGKFSIIGDNGPLVTNELLYIQGSSGRIGNVVTITGNGGANTNFTINANGVTSLPGGVTNSTTFFGPIVMSSQFAITNQGANKMGAIQQNNNGSFLSQSGESRLEYIGSSSDAVQNRMVQEKITNVTLWLRSKTGSITNLFMVSDQNTNFSLTIDGNGTINQIAASVTNTFNGANIFSNGTAALPAIIISTNSPLGIYPKSTTVGSLSAGGQSIIEWGTVITLNKPTTAGAALTCSLDASVSSNNYVYFGSSNAINCYRMGVLGGGFTNLVIQVQTNNGVWVNAQQFTKP